VEDETDLLLFPVLRAGWAKVGEPAKVRLRGWNARRVIFGAMDLRNGRRVLRVRERRTSPDFQDLLRALRRQQADRPIALLLDEDPSHTAQASLSLAELLDIELLWLPKRAPELNPMDRLWRHAKDPISANWQYDTIEKHTRQFVAYLRGMRKQQALRTAGVLNPDFWLHSVL
jgi:hypothetical protein